MSTAFKVLVALPLIFVGHALGFVYHLINAGWIQGELSVQRMADEIHAKKRARQRAQQEAKK